MDIELKTVRDEAEEIIKRSSQLVSFLALQLMRLASELQRVPVSYALMIPARRIRRHGKVLFARLCYHVDLPTDAHGRMLRMVE